MPRFKDLPKTHLHTGDGYKLEQSLKGSLSPVQAEPAIIERISYAEQYDSPEIKQDSKALEEIRWELQEIKKDIQSLKDFVETMDKNGLKMKRQW